MDRDGTDTRAARRLEIVDTADRRYGALDRRREKPPHRLGARAVVDGIDHDGRALDVGVLLHRQRGERSPTNEDDREIHDHREHRVPDEEIGERLHCCAPPAFGASTATRTPSRSLKEPDAATRSPAVRPSRITISSPSIGPLRTGRSCARVLPLSSAAMTNT